MSAPNSRGVGRKLVKSNRTVKHSTKEKPSESETSSSSSSYCVVKLCTTGQKMTVETDKVLLEDSNGEYTIKATDSLIVNSQYGASTSLRILHEGLHVLVTVLSLARTAEELQSVLNNSPSGLGKRQRVPKRRTFTPMSLPANKTRRTNVRLHDKQDTIAQKKALASAKAVVIADADEAAFNKMLSAKENLSGTTGGTFGKSPSFQIAPASSISVVTNQMPPAKKTQADITVGTSGTLPCPQSITPSVKLPRKARNLNTVIKHTQKSFSNSDNVQTKTSVENLNDVTAVEKEKSQNGSFLDTPKDYETSEGEVTFDKENEIVTLKIERDKYRQECEALRRQLKVKAIVEQRPSETDFSQHFTTLKNTIIEHIDKRIVDRESPSCNSPRTQRGIVQVTAQTQLPSKLYIKALKAPHISKRVNYVVAGYWPNLEERISLYFQVNEDDKDSGQKRVITDQEVADILEICTSLQKNSPRDGGDEADLIEGGLTYYISRKLINDRSRFQTAQKGNKRARRMKRGQDAREKKGGENVSDEEIIPGGHASDGDHDDEAELEEQEEQEQQADWQTPDDDQNFEEIIEEEHDVEDGDEYEDNHTSDGHNDEPAVEEEHEGGQTCDDDQNNEGMIEEQEEQAKEDEHEKTAELFNNEYELEYLTPMNSDERKLLGGFLAKENDDDLSS